MIIFAMKLFSAAWIAEKLFCSLSGEDRFSPKTRSGQVSGLAGHCRIYTILVCVVGMNE